jgi:hypothetical protein
MNGDGKLVNLGRLVVRPVDAARHEKIVVCDPRRNETVGPREILSLETEDRHQITRRSETELIQAARVSMLRLKYSRHRADGEYFSLDISFNRTCLIQRSARAAFRFVSVSFLLGHLSEVILRESVQQKARVSRAYADSTARGRFLSGDKRNDGSVVLSV